VNEVRYKARSDMERRRFKSDVNIGKVKGTFMQDTFPDKQFLKESNLCVQWFLE
jgi:hypothetical protein